MTLLLYLISVLEFQEKSMLEEEVISKSDLIYVTYGESEILKQSSAFRQQHTSRFIQRRLDYFFGLT